MDQIRSVDFARAGGASSTFDFQVHLKNKAIEEFSNISRHELACMQDWVNKLKLPIGFPSYSEEDEEEGEEGGGMSTDGEDEDESDADDDDFDPYAHRDKKHKVTEEEEEEEDSSSEDDGDVELVSEEDFKIESLQKMISDEKDADM